MLCVLLVSTTAVTNVVAAKQVPTTVGPQARSFGGQIANYFLRISNTVLRSLGIHLPPGATIYTGTIQRAYSSYPDYTLTYSDAYGTFTVYLPANQITGGTLPNPIPNPVAVDYVYNIDEYHYTLSFSYDGVAYSAHYTTTPPHNPYLSGDAHHCNIVLGDKYKGTVNIWQYDEASGTWWYHPADNVLVHVYVKDCDPPCGTGGILDLGTTHTGTDGKWSMTTGQTYSGSGYVWFSLDGYAPVKVNIGGCS